MTSGQPFCSGIQAHKAKEARVLLVDCVGRFGAMSRTAADARRPQYLATKPSMSPDIAFQLGPKGSDSFVGHAEGPVYQETSAIYHASATNDSSGVMELMEGKIKQGYRGLGHCSASREPRASGITPPPRIGFNTYKPTYPNCCED